MCASTLKEIENLVCVLKNSLNENGTATPNAYNKLREFYEKFQPEIEKNGFTDSLSEKDVLDIKKQLKNILEVNCKLNLNNHNQETHSLA